MMDRALLNVCSRLQGGRFLLLVELVDYRAGRALHVVSNIL